MTGHGWRAIAVAAALAPALEARQAPASPVAPPAVAPERVAVWREDLRFLASELPKRHKYLFFHQPEEEWEAAVADLEAGLERLDEHEIQVEILRLVASVGDGHTAVQMNSAPALLRAVPLELRAFADGIYVTAANRDQAAAVGGKVTAVGAEPIDEAWRRLAEVMAHDNEASLRAHLPGWLCFPGILDALDLADAPDRAAFTLTFADGRTEQVDLGLGPFMPGLVRAWPAAGPPRWLAMMNEPYWSDHRADAKTLFLQYNTCADAPGRPFAELVRKLETTLAAQPVDRFVVDLRHNSGGNSAIFQPLLKLLRDHPNLQGAGHLYACIGPRTASSAMMNALELKQQFGARLVGEPTGGKPNSYGEIRYLDLPKSRLRVSYSTKLFRLTKEDTPSVEPDLLVPLQFADWQKGRDPVFEAIVAGKADAPPRKAR